uniref:Uncharacterized protein n=1 Tax=Nelumbo nucifera TaxID=4432 RepID=A0A822XFW1_NELNU|nr:TPA_asm: hypothetical protein HUJ06_020255 [Nelumbo nucifera]
MVQVVICAATANFSGLIIEKQGTSSRNIRLTQEGNRSEATRDKVNL